MQIKKYHELDEKTVQNIIANLNYLGTGYSKKVYPYNSKVVLKLERRRISPKVLSHYGICDETFQKIPLPLLKELCHFFRHDKAENQTLFEFERLIKEKDNPRVATNLSDLYLYKGQTLYLQERAKQLILTEEQKEEGSQICLESKKHSLLNESLYQALLVEKRIKKEDIHKEVDLIRKTFIMKGYRKDFQLGNLGLVGGKLKFIDIGY